MDFSKAATCAALAFVLTDLVKRLVPVKLPSAVVQLLAVAIGEGTLFLVAATTWAHQNVIGGIALDRMSVWDKIAAGLLVSGLATVIDRLGFVGSRSQDAPGTAALPVVVPVQPKTFPASSDDIFPAPAR
jgi:hypothetical protein